jgi:hypothetical protein
MSAQSSSASRRHAGDPTRRSAHGLAGAGEIERASNDDIAQIAKDFTITNHTATRTLNAGTATLADRKRRLHLHRGHAEGRHEKEQVDGRHGFMACRTPSPDPTQGGNADSLKKLLQTVHGRLVAWPAARLGHAAAQHTRNCSASLSANAGQMPMPGGPVGAVQQPAFGSPRRPIQNPNMRTYGRKPGHGRSDILPAVDARRHDARSRHSPRWACR